MADIRIYSTDKAVGYGHPTYPDVINRPLMVAHDSSGHHSTADFYGFSINKNGTNQVISSGNVIVTFSTNGIFFHSGGFTITSTGFSCPSTGIYYISGQFQMNMTATAVYQQINLLRNSSYYLYGPAMRSKNAGDFNLVFSGIAVCESTTDIFSVNHYAGVASTMTGTSDVTYLGVYKIGGTS